MATLYVTEFGPFVGSKPGPQCAGVPPLAEQTVSIGGGSVSSNAFGAGTVIVRLNTDTSCSIAFGASPTATASTMRMAADQTEDFNVTPGQKAALISN